MGIRCISSYIRSNVTDVFKDRNEIHTMDEILSLNMSGRCLERCFGRSPRRDSQVSTGEKRFSGKPAVEKAEVLR